ncbi:MAG: EamA family transporter [Prevotellaceae bacterium]|nr:EamA family transporter [Prevotellaceae bacterium]
MKYIFIVLCILLTVSAQALLKTTSFHETWSRPFILFVAGSMLTYCLAFVAQSYAMRFFPLSKVSPAMSVATMVLVFICGVLFFKEQIYLKQTVGILLGIVSVYLILS